MNQLDILGKNAPSKSTTMAVEKMTSSGAMLAQLMAGITIPIYLFPPSMR
jgi:hypothetical protein